MQWSFKIIESAIEVIRFRVIERGNDAQFRLGLTEIVMNLHPRASHQVPLSLV